MAGPGKVCGWDPFGKLLERAVDGSGLWSGAAGRVRQRAAGAQNQAGGDGRSMEQSEEGGIWLWPSWEEQEQRRPGHSPCEAGGECRALLLTDKPLFEG